MKPNTAMALATVYRLFPSLRGQLKVGTDHEKNATEMLTLANPDEELGQLLAGGYVELQPRSPWLRVSQRPTSLRDDAMPYSEGGGTAA